MTKAGWLLSLYFLASAFPAGAAELYRWVDAQGQVHVSDSLPPGQTTYTTLNPKGVRVRDIMPPPASASKDLTVQKAHDQQAARLRQLYASEADLKTIRDQRLDDIRATLIFSTQQRSGLVSQLAGLKAREAAFVEAGKVVPPVLQKQIRQSEAGLAAHERAIAQRQQDLEQTRAAYEADLEAYRALVESPAPASGDLKDESASPPPHP